MHQHMIESCVWRSFLPSACRQGRPFPSFFSDSLLEELHPLEAELGRQEIVVHAELLALQVDRLDVLKALRGRRGQGSGRECVFLRARAGKVLKEREETNAACEGMSSS